MRGIVARFCRLPKRGQLKVAAAADDEKLACTKCGDDRLARGVPDENVASVTCSRCGDSICKWNEYEKAEYCWCDPEAPYVFCNLCSCLGNLYSECYAKCHAEGRLEALREGRFVKTRFPTALELPWEGPDVGLGLAYVLDICDTWTILVTPDGKVAYFMGCKGKLMPVPEFVGSLTASRAWRRRVSMAQ